MENSNHRGQYPGRESMIDALAQLWGHSPPSFIHIWDPTSSKDTLDSLSHLLDTTIQPKPLWAHLDPVECISPKILFDRTLNALNNWTPDWENDCINWTGPSGERYNENLDAFLHGLRITHSTMTSEKERRTLVLLFSNAERLKENLPSLITPLARLADLTNLPISTVFISHLSWEDVRPAIGSSVVPTGFKLLPLTSQEQISCLNNVFNSFAAQSSSSVNPFHPVLLPIFSSFVSMVQATCEAYTHLYEDVTYVVATLWPLFISPILNDWKDFDNAKEEIDDDEEGYYIPQNAHSRLSVLFRKHIDNAAFVLVPRLKGGSQRWIESLPSSLWELRLSEFSAARLELEKDIRSTTTKELQDIPELPRYAQYTLVASYLASFNPVRMDKHILGQIRDPLKKTSRKTKVVLGRKAREGTSLKIEPALSGPSTFSLDRLWAITGALMEAYEHDKQQAPWASSFPHSGSITYVDTEITRVWFIGQIEDLINRRLLWHTSISREKQLESQPSYRCAISMEQASSLSNHLGFKIGPLLNEDSL